MNRDEVLQYLRQQKESYAKKYHLSKLILFGSFAVDKADVDSDIDIIYELQGGHRLSADNYFELMDELENRFGRSVDLVREKRINPLIKMTGQKDFICV